MMDKKKSILFVMPKFAPGGAEKSLLMLLDTLVETNQFDIELLLFKKEGAFCNQVPNKVLIRELPEYSRGFYSSRKAIMQLDLSLKERVKLILIRYFCTLYSRLLTKNRNRSIQKRWKLFYRKWMPSNPKSYDYAIGYLDGETIYYVVDKVEAQKKYGWNQNDYKSLGFIPKFDDYYYQKLDGIVTLTDECEKILKSVFPNYIHKIYQIPPIVTQPYIKKCSLVYEPEEYTNYNGYKLISVGRLVKQKGFDLAIKASKILKEKGTDFKWFIIGNGELYEELKKQIERLGLNHYVHLLGENANPYPYISNADIFIQPSRFEGKSIILNEVKMLAKPIIATNYPTIEDQLTNGVNGIIVNFNSLKLSTAIYEVLNNQNLRNTLIKNLHQEVFDDYGIKEQYRKLFRIEN